MDNPQPFLDASPPPWAARALGTLLLCLFVVGVAALILVSVPETVSAVFVIEPARGTDPVRTLHDGTVVRVNVEDAQSVASGAMLFLLSSELVGDRAAEQATLSSRIQGASGRAVNERQRFLNRERADDQERRRLEQRAANLDRLITIKEQELTLAREVAARMKQGAESGLTSWMEASKPQLDVDRLTGEIQQVRSEAVDARNTLERLIFEMASNRAAFDELARSIGEETTGFVARKKALDQDPARRDGQSMEIVSPCAGTVVKLHVRGAGAVVHEGDLLAEVVCSGEELQAELRVPERGMALVRVGQPVKLMSDAFPYERYGVHFGTLRWLSPASSATERGPVFRGLADLDVDTVGVEGARRAVLPGMTGRAAVVVGRRSLASYAIEPLRQLRESLASERSQ